MAEKKKKIRDIINRELIARVPRVNYRQEYGVVGIASYIYTLGGNTVFRTHYMITNMTFVTINGTTQVLHRDYELIGDFQIQFRGIILDDRTISIGYFFDLVESNTIDFPPRLTMFEVTPVTGRDNLLVFSFDIERNSGTNIFWSLHKDGEASPALNTAGEPISGTSLIVNGVDDRGKLVNHEISYNEATMRGGDVVPFTLIILYDLTNDSGQDEKLVGYVNYSLKESYESTLSLKITPDDKITSPVVDQSFDVTYSVHEGSYANINWSLIDPFNHVVDSGNAGNLPVNKVLYPAPVYSFDSGDPSLTYSLVVSETAVPQTVTDTIYVNIPVPELVAEAGWWAKSRFDEIQEDTNTGRTVSEVFSDITERGSHDYFTLTPLNKPGDSGTVIGTLLIDPRVTSDEAGQILSGKHFIIKIPKNWGNVRITYNTFEVIPSSFDIYIGEASSVHTKDYMWYIITDPESLDTEFDIGIQRI